MHEAAEVAEKRAYKGWLVAAVGSGRVWVEQPDVCVCQHFPRAAVRTTHSARQRRRGGRCPRGS